MAGLTKAQPPKQCLFPSFFQHSEAAIANTSVAFSKLTDLHCHFYSHKSAEEKKFKKNLKKKEIYKEKLVRTFQVFKFLRWYGFMGEGRRKI